jgi:RHS repeat-associated protein
VTRGSSRTGYTYDAVGNRLSEQAGGSVIGGSFNEKNQLLSLSPGGTMRWRGSLDEPGSVTFTSATVNGKPARILAGNVFEADLPMAVGTNTVTIRATDTSGNVTTKSYQVDVSGNGASFAYDPNGNLTQKVEGADTWTYEWNAEDRLKRVLQNGNEVARYAYDPLGRRVEKVAGGATTLWAYDGDDILRRTAGSAVTKYAHGSGIDEPLAVEDSGGALSYYHADGLGSIVKTTNSSGVVAQTNRYDAWGVIEQGSPSPYGFTGREPDVAGLAYDRARYYDPKLGRFLSEDPIGLRGGLNFYAYATNNPVRYTDPSGLQSQDEQSYSMCMANCIEKERFDLVGTACSLVGAFGFGTMPKMPRELRGLGVPKEDLNPYTGQPSRWARRTGIRGLRDFGRSAAGKAAGAATTAAVVFEGFYDIGTIGRCSVVCGVNTGSY